MSFKPEENKKSEFQIMTHEKIAKALKNVTKAKEFMESNNLKITPAMKVAGLAEEFIGLIIASNQFYPNIKNKFSTYSVYWIKQRIIRFIERDTVIRVPSLVHSHRSKIQPLSDYSDEEAAEILERRLKDEDGNKRDTRVSCHDTQNNRSHKGIIQLMHKWLKLLLFIRFFLNL